MSLGNKLNKFYTFIINKNNRALNYYNTIIEMSYNSIQDVNIIFDINKLDNFSTLYCNELLLIKDIHTKYDVSKISKNYYQDEEFNKIISNDLNWLLLKCDKTQIQLDKDKIEELDYKLHFCYSLKPFENIYYLYNGLLQRYCRQRRNVSLYMLSDNCISVNFNSFILSIILVEMLSANLIRDFRQNLSFSDATTQLKTDFDNYIDNNQNIVSDLNTYILNNIYRCYINEFYNFNTSTEFNNIKNVFKSFVDDNNIFLFNELVQIIIPSLLSLSCILDVIEYLYSNSIQLISNDQMQLIMSTEQEVYSQIFTNHSLIKMLNYMIIPYKYKDPVKFVHLIPVVVEAYVDNYLYPQLNAVEIFKKLVYNCGIDYLQFDYQQLASTINSYISTIPQYFLAKSNYEKIVDLAVRLQLHKIVYDFFNSQRYKDWQLNYLKTFHSRVEYDPYNVNYIYKQNFVKLFLINRFLYDMYINNYTFGYSTHEYIKTQVYNYLSTIDYEFSDTIIRNDYDVFTNIYLNNQFKKFVDTFIFSSIINDIVIDRLNYYLLK